MNENGFDLEEMAKQIYCVCMDRDYLDYIDDWPDDVQGIECDLEILSNYGGGYILQSLEMMIDEIQRGKDNGGK